MKGVIVNCLNALVKEKFGEEKWSEILEKSGLNKKTTFLATEDVDDGIVMKLINSTCEVLKISLPEAADAFGEYWVCNFAPKIYGIYYRGVNSAKDFLLKMDNIHDISTKNIKGARPPRFEYEWKDQKTLIMKYKSHRGLVDIMAGLIKGVGKYFKEDIVVTRLGNDRVQVVFP